MFRVTINPEGINGNHQKLGDRVLSGWVGKDDGVLHFPTYTYRNMNGEGNANYFQNIVHKNRIMSWHFIYFGYTRSLRKARSVVKFGTNYEAQLYDNVNHYVPQKLLLYLGHDMPTTTYYSGDIAQFRVLLGEGAFKMDNKFEEEGDPFGLLDGLNSLFDKRPNPLPKDR